MTVNFRGAICHRAMLVAHGRQVLWRHMNYLDYREQLGIGFDDSEKRELFITRVHGRFMQGKSLWISLENERAFCYQVGALCERDRDSLSIYPEYQGGSTSASGLDRVWSDYFEDYDQPYPRYLFDDEGEEEAEEEKKQSRLEFYEFLALSRRLCRRTPPSRTITPNIRTRCQAQRSNISCIRRAISCGSWSGCTPPISWRRRPARANRED